MKKKEDSSLELITPPLGEGEDFYFDERGLMVFTKSYHLKRGTCCDSGCLHCPYKDGTSGS